MNRTIKFRAQRVDGEGWVYGHLLTRDIDTGNIYIRELNPDNVPPRYTDYLVHPSTVGQFTGLTDRNKAEIFIGDDLKFKNGTTAVVVWDEVGIGLQSPSGAVDRIESKRELWRAEVIGNIHEPVNSD